VVALIIAVHAQTYFVVYDFGSHAGDPINPQGVGVVAQGRGEEGFGNRQRQFPKARLKTLHPDFNLKLFEPVPIPSGAEALRLTA
jgi:hypothetical protein